MDNLRKYRFNRAVGAHNEGDMFMARQGDPYADTLLGAGYTDIVLELQQEDEPELFSDFEEEEPKKNGSGQVR